ncbi:transglycosylase SLT domain-containing protein [Phyllobacterium sp. SB3]|uniref:transglycosylase SLT domain-containing protein n=1 Tax=Phyllobacterium sp. SB3 TaxID=3156073 RepID=UPI0032AEDDE9
MTLKGPQSAGSATDSSAVTGWQEFYADRLQRKNSATDDALRAHFEAELKQAKLTMDAMGLKPGDAGPPAAENVKSPDNANGQFIEPDKQKPEVLPEKNRPGSEKKPVDVAGAGNSGTDALGPGLHENLKPYSEDILKASKATGVPADLLAAVIWDESKGEASAGTVNGENGQTDSGLMQVNPGTFATLKSTYPDLLPGNNQTEPQTNVMAGALYLKEQFKEFGSWDLALRAYNSGPGSVDRSDPSASTTGLGTKNYVEKVNYFWNIVSKGGELPLSGYPGGNGSFA